MAKPRVHELAKELGLTSKEVLAHLAKIGQEAKSHASTVEESVADRVRTDLGNGAAPKPKVAKGKKAPAAEGTGKAGAKAPAKTSSKTPAKAAPKAPPKPTPAGGMVVQRSTPVPKRAPVTPKKVTPAPAPAAPPSPA
ncbi:MAG: translation initiation factor IF-2 N-terminal domain-containing protein, partial [Actinomycetota bacterium]|nr:translation initiation factor IF-2 N-terminal domain-containing protein [Actinomycetota bacterium]